MVKLSGKRIVVFIIIFVALVFGGFFGFKALNHTNRPLSKAEQDDFIKKGKEAFDKQSAAVAYTEDSIAKQLIDVRLTELYKKLRSKEYTEVTASAAILCKQLTETDQVFCYTFYGQAVAAQKDYATYKTVAAEALASPAVKANETATLVWQKNLAKANKGSDPYTVPTDAEIEEARK